MWYEVLNSKEDDWMSKKTNIKKKKRNPGTEHEPSGKSWSKKRYRGQSSMNVPEALGWSNKTMLYFTIGLLVVVGVVYYKYGNPY